MTLSRFDASRVLVIDDTLANVELLEAVLRRAGLRHVYSVTDAREALSTIEAINPDLIVLDLHMPWVDGFTILAETVRRAAGTYLPVVVMTADTTSEVSHRALSAGARDFLTKPFDFTEVILRVGNLLETRQLHQHVRRVSGALAGQLGEIRRQESADIALRESARRNVESVLEQDSLRMVFQPVIDTSTGDVIGFEALARFPGDPPRGPDKWFADASAAGLGPALEMAAVASAVRALPQLPDGTFLAVNISAETLLGTDLRELVSAVGGERIVLELTEHQPVEDYEPLMRALEPLRECGARLAVDDTGAGYASLRHILALRPDIIKLDISLVRDIHHDPARRALAASLVSFANETGTQLVAEGIENAEELAALTALGVRWGQGYYLGRPAALSSPAERQAATA
ncbi:MAG: response regulator receiver modulated diguanylate phosphodiesterase [Frankiales bacterium]|nr:response regulator receiver modulated diguanylate phosphodiesterase [Frankiales bacterium]